MRKNLCFLILLVFVSSGWNNGMAQQLNRSLVGYWQNWNDGACPFIQLNEINTYYNVICVAFAMPKAGTDYDMDFVPEGISVADFKTQIDTLQAQGKKVVISIGGATAAVKLDDTTERAVFVASMLNIIQTYGFDGVDIDIEGGSLSITGGTITNPVDPPIINMIEAIKEIMASFHAINGMKMFLGMAPETVYVQGGMSAYAGIWGAYLPLIHALRDSLEIIYVQLYNSGSMYGIDGEIYNSGTPDFIVSQCEALLQGFTTNGGHFDALQPDQVAVGLPACQNAAGSGFIDTAVVKDAVDYLMGLGPKPGNYTLVDPNGYLALRGMMTWSINWDKVSTCGSTWEFAVNYARIFGLQLPVFPPEEKGIALQLYPNPADQQFIVQLPPNSNNGYRIILYDLFGRTVREIRTSVAQHDDTGKELSLVVHAADLPEGLFVLHCECNGLVTARKLMIHH